MGKKTINQSNKQTNKRNQMKDISLQTPNCQSWTLQLALIKRGQCGAFALPH